MTVDFGGNDERQPLTLQIFDDEVGEGEERIQLSLTTDSMLEGVITGVNATTEIVIVEDDCKFDIPSNFLVHCSVMLLILICTHIIAVIGYRYTQTVYSFREDNSSAEVCLEITTGTFPPGGTISFSLSTRPQTATGN